MHLWKILISNHSFSNWATAFSSFGLRVLNALPNSITLALVSPS